MEAQREEVKSGAQNENPKLIQLSAFITFLVHAVSSSSSCAYIVQRMLADEVFPQGSEYGADETGTKFCADLMKLAVLLETDTRHAVTMLDMSARLYMHIRCMQERWFGPQPFDIAKDDDADDGVGVARGDDETSCLKRPKLEKPELSR